MFYTLKSRLLLGAYIFIILSIPVGAYLATQVQTFKSKAAEKTNSVTKTNPKTATSSAKELLSISQTKLADKPNPTDSPAQASSPTVATSFGPTMSLQVILEGRPANNQATKLFVGIVEGVISANSKFLLSFTVDLPASGIYKNLSLAGLQSGSQYTALLKGTTQIATSSAFIMSPAVTNLNNGQPLNLLTGDLNEDNTIDSSDLSIAQKASGSTAGSGNWNENADFNIDGKVNAIDLAIIRNNMNKAGESGIWTSPIPKAGAASAPLTQSEVGSPQNPGYWLWIPK